MAKTLGQQRATSVQMQNEMERRGRVATDDDKKLAKTRLQEETQRYLEERKKKRQEAISRKHEFYKQLFSGLIFKL